MVNYNRNSLSLEKFTLSEESKKAHTRCIHIFTLSTGYGFFPVVYLLDNQAK